jgi:hypothetical protein
VETGFEELGPVSTLVELEESRDQRLAGVPDGGVLPGVFGRRVVRFRRPRRILIWQRLGLAAGRAGRGVVNRAGERVGFGASSKDRPAFGARRTAKDPWLDVYQRSELKSRSGIEVYGNPLAPRAW